VSEWSEVFSAQVENAKWLVDRESTRIDGFHQRSSYLLGFAGVILAILPTTLDPIESIEIGHLKLAAWCLVTAAALTLSIGALFALLTIAVRKSLEVPVKGMQRTYVEWSQQLNDPDSAQVLADMTNALMGRESTAEASAVLAIRAEGDVRALRLRISVWLTTAGILALGMLFLILVAGRIWK